MLPRLEKYSENLFFVNGETNLRDHESSQTYLLNDWCLRNLHFFTLESIFLVPLQYTRGGVMWKNMGVLLHVWVRDLCMWKFLLALTVDSFLSHFRRLFSRQGKVHTSFSDNGMNFVGAEKELRRTLREQNTNLLTWQHRRWSVRWHFYPALASMGVGRIFSRGRRQ